MATDVTNTNDLTDDEVNELLAGSKQKGQYDAILASFIDSGVRGRRYPLDSGQFNGKALQSVKTGFTNAVKRASADGKVRVIGNKDAGFVALVNTAS
jgi:hypothetical protein